MARSICCRSERRRQRMLATSVGWSTFRPSCPEGQLSKPVPPDGDTVAPAPDTRMSRRMAFTRMFCFGITPSPFLLCCRPQTQGRDQCQTSGRGDWRSRPCGADTASGLFRPELQQSRRPMHSIVAVVLWLPSFLEHSTSIHKHLVQVPNPAGFSHQSRHCLGRPGIESLPEADFPFPLRQLEAPLRNESYQVILSANLPSCSLIPCRKYRHIYSAGG